MKRILLTSTALVMTAGIAAADVSFSGTVSLGYNDSDHTGAGPATVASEGFYVDGDLNVSMSTELDNGLTAGADFEIDFWGSDSSNFGDALSASDSVVYLKSDNAGLYFGDTTMAATKHWMSAGDMEADSFSTGTDDSVLRGDISFGGTSVSLSVIDPNATSAESTEQMSLGVSGTAGAFKYALAYQEETSAGYLNGNGDFSTDEVIGVAFGGTFGGADVTLAYAEDKSNSHDSLGLKVGYTFGDVKATVYYVDESNGDANIGVNVAYASGPLAVALDWQDDQGTEKLGLTGSYDMGNGMKIFAGVLDDGGNGEDAYVGVTYDLGGGASALVSYADNGDMDDDGDEIGPNDYKEGLTVEVSFSF